MIPCGVDPGRFQPIGACPRQRRLLAIGRLAPQKGYEVLLDALALTPAAFRPCIDIVGEGALRPVLEARIAGTSADGEPVCATVPLLGGGWQLRPARP